MIKDFTDTTSNTSRASSLIFFSIFALTLAFFHYVDVYHKHFFSHGWLISTYQVLRFIFAINIFWIFYFSGKVIVSKIFKIKDLKNLEMHIVAFFIGLAIWQISLFVVGLLGLYNYYLLTGITLLISCFSLNTLNITIYQLKRKIFSLNRINTIGLILLISIFSLFIVTKGLYPAGGHDYYTHYFYFYNKVLENGSVLPNEVWYHFYYSKGFAVAFYAMFLSDPLAPQLIGTIMVLVGAGIVYSLLKQEIYPFLSWIGAILFVAFLIYTPGPLESMQNGGWGDLEKLHEASSILVFAVIWVTIQLYTSQYKALWGVALTLTLLSFISLNLPGSIVACIYTSVIFLLAACTRHFRLAAWYGGALILSGITVAVMLAINFFFTGIPTDQGLFTFWPYLNFDKVRSSGLMFELLILHWAKTGLVANQVALNLNFFQHLISYLRLDIWGFFLIIAIPLFIINKIFIKGWQINTSLIKIKITPLTIFFSCVIIFSFFAGRDQSISFYRYTSFCYGPMLCLALLLLTSTLDKKTKFVMPFLALGLIFFGFSLFFLLASGKSQIKNISTTTILEINAKFKHNLTSIFSNSFKLMFGKYSLLDAYQNQQGWPGRMPWGGVYPPMKNVWELVNKKERIWSMHIHSYCMLPDCNLQTYMSFRLSPHTDIIYYGTPLAAKKILQEEGLNYFFISLDLQLRDPLPLSPLFNPDNISNYLGIYWTDGNNALLTWKENAKETIPTEWLTGYRKIILDSPTVQSFPYQPLSHLLQTAVQPSYTVTLNEIPWNHAGWH